MNTYVHADQLEVGMSFRTPANVCTVVRILDSPVKDRICFRYIKDTGRTTTIRQTIVTKNHAYRLA